MISTPVTEPGAAGPLDVLEHLVVLELVTGALRASSSKRGGCRAPGRAVASGARWESARRVGFPPRPGRPLHGCSVRNAEDRSRDELVADDELIGIVDYGRTATSS